MSVLIEAERFASGMKLQLASMKQALALGMPRRGWKIGINAPEMLDSLDLPHPGVGWLDGRRVFDSGAQLSPRAQPSRAAGRVSDAEQASGAEQGGGSVAAEHATALLHVEPELAIHVSQTVPPDCSTELARSRIGHVHPALEIVDYAKPRSGLDDVVGHCMFHDATVLGPAAPLGDVRDLGKRWPLLRVGATEAGPPRFDLVPPDPGDVVAFVAAYLGMFGEFLEAGDLVLSGSYTARAVPLPAGAEAVADFGPLGRVSIRRVD